MAKSVLHFVLHVLHFRFPKSELYFHYRKFKNTQKPSIYQRFSGNAYKYWVCQNYLSTGPIPVSSSDEISGNLDKIRVSAFFVCLKSWALF